MQTNKRWYPCFLPDDYRRRLNRDLAQVEAAAALLHVESNAPGGK
jgi:hypothetical protein